MIFNRYKLFLLFFLLFVNFFCFSQGFLSKESVEKLHHIKYKYPSDEVVGLSSTIKYTFNFKKYNQSGWSKINVQEDEDYEVMSLKANYYFSNSIWYDNQSTVSNIVGYEGKNKLGTIYASDHAYESNGYFHSDVRVKTYGKQFNSSGETARFLTSKYYVDIKYLTSIYFNEYFPIEHKVITIEIPDGLDIELKEMNFEGYNIKKEEDITKNKAHIITYTADGLIGTKQQSHIPGPSHILPHILVLPKSYSYKNESATLFATTDDLYKWYHSLILDTKNDPDPIKPIVGTLVAEKKTDDEKIKAIYYWVQDNIRYIAFEAGLAGFKPATAQQVFEKRYGDCKGMANLLKTMLVIAGYDARLTWVGTRYIAYDYSIPSLCVDNHMICTVILNGKRIFLDGTENYIAYQKYAHRIQSRPVMIEDGDKYILDKIPEYEKEVNLVSEKTELTIDGTDLKGKVESLYEGEPKVGLLNYYYNTKAENRQNRLISYLLNNDKDMEVKDFTSSGLSNREEDLKFTYNFTEHNQIVESNNEFFVTVDNEKNFMKSDFDSTRQFDYEFAYKIDRVEEVKVIIPKGFKVKYMPEPVKQKYNDFSFDLSYTLNNGIIYYKKIITIDNGIVHKKDFKDWNACISAIRKFYEDQIILVKN